MRTDTIYGLAVVSIADGARLGRVDDLLFDARGLRLTALVVATGARRRVTLPFGELRQIGADAVTVPSARSVEGYGDLFAGLPNLDRLRRLKVVDEAGTLLGAVRDLDIDPRTGQLTAVDVHHGGFLGVGGRSSAVARDDILSLGDVMVISSRAGLEPEAEDDPGTAVERRSLERER